MTTQKELLKRIEKLEARNARVESDKAWETSWMRKLLIMALTYLVLIAYLHFVVHISPWINGLVPVLGYLMSTLTISAVKQHWIQTHQK